MLCRRCSCRGVFFFFQAEDGIRDLVRSRGLGDVYKRQPEQEAGDPAADEHHGAGHEWRCAAGVDVWLSDRLSLIHI